MYERERKRDFEKACALYLGTYCCVCIFFNQVVPLIRLKNDTVCVSLLTPNPLFFCTLSYNPLSLTPMVPIWWCVVLVDDENANIIVLLKY